MVSWLVNRIRGYGRNQKGYIYLQRCSLVNIKLKWVKDEVLDEAVFCQRDLKAASMLVSLISSSPESSVPIFRLRPHREQLGIPYEVKVSEFIRKYPSIFHESYIRDSAGTRVPSFSLTPEASSVRQEELHVLQECQMDLVNRVQKLLMLVRYASLPLETIDQLKWDLGLPDDYHKTLIPHYRKLFSIVTRNDRDCLKLLLWDNHLAVSHLQKNAGLPGSREGMVGDCLAFPIGFTKGFGLRKKCTKWLAEWQTLPYTSPYSDASHLDPRTDVSEKRIVGVFHELLHLTIHKQTDRYNVSNLRKPLGLPQKFTKVFERHPGIFYISMKRATQTVVLREAFDGSELLEKHPLVEIRQKYGELMEKGLLEYQRVKHLKNQFGLLDRSRGLYPKVKDGKEHCVFRHSKRSKVRMTQRVNRSAAKQNVSNMIRDLKVTLSGKKGPKLTRAMKNRLFNRPVLCQPESNLKQTQHYPMQNDSSESSRKQKTLLFELQRYL